MKTNCIKIVMLTLVLISFFIIDYAFLLTLNAAETNFKITQTNDDGFIFRRNLNESPSDVLSKPDNIDDEEGLKLYLRDHGQLLSKNYQTDGNYYEKILYSGSQSIL